jgi:hypothetical protein
MITMNDSRIATEEIRMFAEETFDRARELVNENYPDLSEAEFKAKVKAVALELSAEDEWLDSLDPIVRRDIQEEQKIAEEYMRQLDW